MSVGCRSAVAKDKHGYGGKYTPTVKFPERGGSLRVALQYTLVGADIRYPSALRAVALAYVSLTMPYQRCIRKVFTTRPVPAKQAETAFVLYQRVVIAIRDEQ